MVHSGISHLLAGFHLKNPMRIELGGEQQYGLFLFGGDDADGNQTDALHVLIAAQMLRTSARTWVILGFPDLGFLARWRATLQRVIRRCRIFQLRMKFEN